MTGTQKRIKKNIENCNETVLLINFQFKSFVAIDRVELKDRYSDFYGNGN